MSENKKGEVDGCQPSQSQTRHHSPIILHLQQKNRAKLLFKSPIPQNNQLNNVGVLEIKINKITNPNLINGGGESLINQISPPLMNKKQKNASETHSFSKSIPSCENKQKKEDISIYSPHPNNPEEVKRNVSKRVLIRQGLQGERFMSSANDSQTQQKVNNQFIQKQMKGLNQSMDLSIVANNSIMYDTQSYTTHRDNNRVFPSYNIQTQKKYQDHFDNDTFKKESTYQTNQSKNLNFSSSKKIHTHDGSISYDPSYNSQQQQRQFLSTYSVDHHPSANNPHLSINNHSINNHSINNHPLSINNNYPSINIQQSSINNQHHQISQHTLMNNQPSQINDQHSYMYNQPHQKNNPHLQKNNQPKIVLQFEQISPIPVVQSSIMENSQYNSNNKLQKVFSKTKSSFEESSELYLKQQQFNAEKNMKQEKMSQNNNNRNRSLKRSQIYEKGKVNSQKQNENEQEQRSTYQKYDQRDYLPLHLKILEEYQNDTLVKREPSPPLPHCNLIIQSTQLAKKYQLFLRNQKNKTSIAQKSSLTPQKSKATNKQGILNTNESLNQTNPEKLPDIKQNSSIIDQIAENLDDEKRESIERCDLNINIRKLDTETECLKQKSRKSYNNQKLKFNNNAERLYKQYAQNQQQNNRLYTQQVITPSISQIRSQQDNTSHINNNYVYTDEYNNSLFKDISAVAFEQPSVSILDIKNSSEMNISKDFDKQANQLYSQNLNNQHLQTSTSPQLQQSIYSQSNSIVYGNPAVQGNNLAQGNSVLSQINIMRDDRSSVHIKNRKSQKLLQFLQLQTYKQQIQYVQHAQLIQQQSQKIKSENEEIIKPDSNSIQISSSLNGYYDISQNHTLNTNYQQEPLNHQNLSPEPTLNKKILRPRNLSGINNRTSPRKGIQVSRLDLSSNNRDCVYYSLNTSENYINNHSQDIIINQNGGIQTNQTNENIQNKFYKHLNKISKTLNNTQFEANEDMHHLQNISRSMAHQTADAPLQQYIQFNKVRSYNNNKSTTKRQEKDSHVEKGFIDDTNHLLQTWNKFSIEDYVSQMKKEDNGQRIQI